MVSDLVSSSSVLAGDAGDSASAPAKEGDAMKLPRQGDSPATGDPSVSPCSDVSFLTL